MNNITAEEYKKLIDALVELANEPSATMGRIRTGENVFSQSPNSEQQRREATIISLSSKQKEVVVELLLNEHSKVIEETLAFLKSEKYRISYDNVPFDEDLSSNFRARLEESARTDKDSSSH